MAYFHKMLNNPKGSVNQFDASRGFDNEPEEEEEIIPKDYEYQKGVLNNALDRFEQSAARKYERRTFPVPANIDYVRIDFLVTFDNFDEYKTKDRFIKDFGLTPVRFYNFNKSVLFEISDDTKFDRFYKLIMDYVKSNANESPTNKPYNIITILAGFEFLSREILIPDAELSDSGNSIVLELTRQDQSSLEKTKVVIESALLQFLKEKNITVTSSSKIADTQFLTLSRVSRVDITDLVDHFDVIASIQAIRVQKITTLKSGTTMRGFDFQISLASADQPNVAIIDNGVNAIPPLRENLSSLGYTFDSAYPAYQTSGWHGTAVAVLASVGEDFFSGNKQIDPACRIVSYRIFENHGGQIDFTGFESNIRNAYQNGVRLFNLSANTRFKLYNGDYSYFGFLLDKLSYELDILFFISAGNLDAQDLENIYKVRRGQVPYHDMLDYPKHFYYPNEYCDEHSCEGTNLKEPGDSLNNMTIGAIAENFEKESKTDLTLDKSLPAYYTSKYHISPYHKVNGTRLKSKHINYKMVKPDVVYPGGDYGVESAGIQLVGSGVGNDFYRLECGTSFSAPLATNLAAKLIRLYPALNMQSIKALIINSAVQPADSDFLKRHLSLLKETISNTEFKKTFAALNKAEKFKVNKWCNDKDLLFKLIGHGVPNTQSALSSSRKSITVIIEDQIKVNTHKAIPINIPSYLNKFSKSTPIVEITATLAFKFQPNFKEQTGYNPLHISFNFVRSIVDPNHLTTNEQHTAKVVAYKDGMPFYDDLYRGAFDAPERTQRRNRALGVKDKVGSWSDDFFPNGRQFSNTQKLDLLINAAELNKTGNNLSLTVRCLGKKETGFDTSSYLAGNHPYSIVLTFEERKNKEFLGVDFYEEFSKINQTLSIVAQTEVDADLEAEG